MHAELQQYEQPIDAHVPTIVVEPMPAITITSRGTMREDAAALYLTYLTRNSVSARTLRDWRAKKIGPKYSRTRTGRGVWYERAHLDEYAHDCVIDPLDLD